MIDFRSKQPSRQAHRHEGRQAQTDGETRVPLLQMKGGNGTASKSTAKPGSRWVVSYSRWESGVAWYQWPAPTQICAPTASSNHGNPGTRSWILPQGQRIMWRLPGKVEIIKHMNTFYSQLFLINKTTIIFSSTLNQWQTSVETRIYTLIMYFS